MELECEQRREPPRPRARLVVDGVERKGGAAHVGREVEVDVATPGRLDAMQRALVRERGRFLFTDATEAPGAAERAAPGTPPDETEREMHAMIIRQIEAQRNGADGSFLARDWLKEAGTRPARCEA